MAAIRQNHPGFLHMAGRWALRILLYGALFGIGVFAGLINATIGEVEDLERSSQFRHFEGVIFARDGHTVLRKLRAQTSRRYVAESAIPKTLSDAVVAAEDHRFYTHPGIDIWGIARAARRDLAEWRIVEGGSTITQQMVKNAYLGPRRSFSRKSREALLALAVDARWSKRRILASYLNTAYFGNGAYGIRDASKIYFNADVKHLNIAQSALLASLLRSPQTDDPFLHTAQSLARRNQVITSMRELKMITPKIASLALQRPMPTPYHTRVSSHELAAHFVDSAIGQLINQLGTSEALGGGLRVRTTLDARMQRAALRAAHSIDKTGISSVVVAIEPRSGEIRALAMGGSASKHALDVASIGVRQPGSAFKPFTLLAALTHGYSLESQVESAPFVTKYPHVGTVKVTNDGGYVGYQSLRHATWFSDNTVFARVAKAVGITSIIDIANRLGITTKIDPYPATILGGLTQGVHPLDLAHAYATLDNHGLRVGERQDSPAGQSAHIANDDPRGIRPIRIIAADDRHGDMVWEPERTSVRALPRPVADLATQAMQGVIQHGTGVRASIGRPAAGKTGTTENNVDAWFVGYTPQLVAAVWVGHPEGSVPMSNEFHGEEVVGGSYPALIWKAFMSSALQGTSPRSFSITQPRYRTLFIDAATGLRTNAWCSTGKTTKVLVEYIPSDESNQCVLRAPRVPNVVGKTQMEATKLLETLGYEYNLIDANLGNGIGKVIVTTQAPAAASRPLQPIPIQLWLQHES